MEFKKRRLQLKLKRLRLERKTNRPGEEGGKQIRQGVRLAFGDEKSSLTSPYIDKKDDLDSYLLQFKSYVTVANWPQVNWAIQFSPLLGEKALDVYSTFLQENE